VCKRSGGERLGKGWEKAHATDGACGGGYGFSPVAGKRGAWAVNEIGIDGPDTLRGTNRADNLVSLRVNDRIFSLAGQDNLLGELGRDFMVSGTRRLASGGDKNMVGGPGNDAVGGGLGSDNVVGQEGNDFLVGGPGLEPREAPNDKLSGGAGNDVFDALNRPAAKDVVSSSDGLDRVFADSEDVLASDCEKVLVGLASLDEFIASIPESFWEGLPQL
jgi:Ca2+-binding RTX toxin-like protein